MRHYKDHSHRSFPVGHQHAINHPSTTTSNTNIISMSSINDIATTSSEEKNVASIDNMTIVSSDNKNASSPDTKGTKSSNGTRTTTNKRKQVFDDAQEEAQESPKKRARALTGFEFVRDTFGYTFKDLSLLFEALDTTSTYRAQSNQSLALIGDSILQTTIYRDWYPSKQLKGMLDRT
jgi:hypothetical protein